jgi:tetratricopeptide (TPR) repeat protein
VLAESQQSEAAEEAMRKSIELAPKFAAAYRCLVQFFLAGKRNLPEAKALAEQLVALEPSASNYELLAEACYRTSDLSGARAAFERALEIEPGNERLKAASKALQERK